MTWARGVSELNFAIGIGQVALPLRWRRAFDRHPLDKRLAAAHYIGDHNSQPHPVDGGLATDRTSQFNGDRNLLVVAAKPS